MICSSANRVVFILTIFQNLRTNCHHLSTFGRSQVGNWVGRKKTSAQGRLLFELLAERAGFEPAVGYEPTHAFQACDLNRSSTFPRKRVL